MFEINPCRRPHLGTLADPTRVVLCILAVGLVLMIAGGPASAQTLSPGYEAEHVGPDGIAFLDGSKHQAGGKGRSSLEFGSAAPVGPDHGSSDATRYVFTAPYSRGNPGMVTDCLPGADVCHATGAGGAEGIFDVSSEITRTAAISSEDPELAYGFASATQRIKVPKGVSQANVRMTFHGTDMATSADASHGSASSHLLVFADALPDYCPSKSECTAIQGKATLESSYDRAGFVGLLRPNDDVGPDAVVTLTITAPSGSTLPTKHLYVIGAATSISSLRDTADCLGCSPGHAGSASSSARVALERMEVSFS